MRVLTIGHSTRTAEEFVALLRGNGVQHLVDVRKMPGSRRMMWTSIDTLPALLASEGIAHTHLPELGGLRKAREDSPNAAWENPSFRGYADHMGTEEFERGLEKLLRIAEREVPCLMCAEAVPWRCHRNLVADALVARDVEVLHIVSGSPTPHAMTKFARVEGGRVTYPPAARQTRLGE